jgi:hypothetical protein
MRETCGKDCYTHMRFLSLSTVILNQVVFGLMLSMNEAPPTPPPHARENKPREDCSDGVLRIPLPGQQAGYMRTSSREREQRERERERERDGVYKPLPVSHT